MAYTTAAALRAHMAPATFDASDTTVADTVTEFEEIAEDYLGQAFQARSTSEPLVPTGGVLLLSKSDATAITALVYETGTAPNVNTTKVDPGGVAVLLPRGTCWPNTVITATYTYGTATVPQRLIKACWLYVALTLQSEISGTSRDVISQAFDGATTRYSTPNRDEGRPTGWLDVDRLLNTIRGARAPMVA